MEMKHWLLLLFSGLAARMLQKDGLKEKIVLVVRVPGSLDEPAPQPSSHHRTSNVIVSWTEEKENLSEIQYIVGIAEDASPRQRLCASSFTRFHLPVHCRLAGSSLPLAEAPLRDSSLWLIIKGFWNCCAVEQSFHTLGRCVALIGLMKS